MHPLRDIDAILLLATALAAKRRAASLREIVAATWIFGRAFPSESGLRKAFLRLSSHGLIESREGHFRLSRAAEDLLAGQARTKSPETQVQQLGQALRDYAAADTHPAIRLEIEEIRGAILAQQAAAREGGGNLLMPRPKAAERDRGRPGQGRTPAGRGRKTHRGAR